MNSQPIQKRPLRRLIRYGRVYRRQTILATLYSILNKIFDLVPPFLIGAAVDVVVAREDSLLAQIGISNVSTQLWILALITIVVWSGESYFQYLFA